MHRPCFLVVDREHEGSISTRKLVIESAKLNVITAFSGQEAVETLKRFAEVDAVVLDANMPDMPCGEIIQALRKIKPSTPVIAIGSFAASGCAEADYLLSSFEPPKLLEFLRKLVPEAGRLIEADERSQEVSNVDGNSTDAKPNRSGGNGE